MENIKIKIINKFMCLKPANSIWVTGLIIVGVFTTLPYWNAKGDDAFILFRLVKNYVEHGELAYNLGECIYAFTSPVWFGLLSSVYAFMRDMYISVWVVCLSSLFFCVIMLWLLASKVIRKTLFRALAVLIVLVDPWFMRWAFAGQEITFKIAIVASLIWIASWFFYKSNKSIQHYLIIGLSFTFGILTRPEIGLLFLIVVSILIYFRVYKAALFVAITVLFSYGAWALFCYIKFGSFLPHTILVKASNLRGGLAISSLFIRILTYATPRYVAIVILPVIGLLILSLVVSFRYPQVLRQLKDRYATALLFFWVVGVSVGYFISGTFMVSMYTLIFSPFISLMCFAILDAADRCVRGPIVQKFAWISTAVVFLVSLGLFIFRLGSFSWLNSNNYDLGDDYRYIEYGEWINASLPFNARIATSELGIVGWFGCRYMIDLAGIATPAMLSSNANQVLIDLKPTHFSLYGKSINRYGPFILEKVKTVMFRRIGGSKSIYDEDTCTLYRIIEFSDGDTSSP